MPTVQVVPPSGLPVSVSEARAFCRYPHTDEDSLFESLIEAATDHVQQASNRQLMPATFLLTLRAWPADMLIRLPRSPLIEVLTVAYRDPSTGDLEELQEDVDYAVSGSDSAVIEPLKRWPRHSDREDAIQIVFSAGYQGEESPSDPAAHVPPRAKLAIMALVAHWFENRTPVEYAAPHVVPLHLSRLINGIRTWR